METQSLIPSFEATELHSSDIVAGKAINTLSSEIEAFKTLANPLLCEAEYLPYLAYAYKVDFWSEELKEEEKRELIKKSVLLHRYKGAVWCIEEILKLLNLSTADEPATIKEGLSIKYDGKYKYNGIFTYADETKWPCYVINLTKPVSIKRAKFAKEMLDKYAPKRCILHAITYNQLNRYDGGIKYDGTYTYGIIGADKL